MNGPPIVTPNWLRCSVGFLKTAGLNVNPVAFRSVLRRNSYKVPCSALVPERVAALMTAPLTRPYCALKLLVITRNSASASGEGCTTWLEYPWLLGEYALLSRPSSRKLLYVLRIPFTLKAPSRGVPVAENRTDMGDR